MPCWGTTLSALGWQVLTPAAVVVGDAVVVVVGAALVVVAAPVVVVELEPPLGATSRAEVLGLDRVQELPELPHQLLGAGVVLVVGTVDGQENPFGVHEFI